MPPSAAAVAAVALLGSLLTSSGFVGAPSLASRGQVSSMTRANLTLDDTTYIPVLEAGATSSTSTHEARLNA